MLPDPYNAHVDVSAVGSTTEEFTVVENSGRNTERVCKGAAQGEPQKLKIQHKTAGKGDAIRDRHLVRLESYVVEDGSENTAKPIVLYAVADIPRIGPTDTQLTAMFEQFVGLLRGASGDPANEGDQTVFFDRWLLGES